MSSVNEATRPTATSLMACLAPAPGAPSAWPEADRPHSVDTWSHEAPEEAARSPWWRAPEAEAVRLAFVRAQKPIPQAEDVAAMAAFLAQEPEARPVADRVAQLMTGMDTDPEPPPTELWQRALAPLVRGYGPRIDPAQVHAFVFTVMLEAQRAATEEKRDALRSLKMYAEMIEALNDKVAQQLTPALQGINQDMAAQNRAELDPKNKKAGKQDPNRLARIERRVEFPMRIDTRWGTTDAATGKVGLIVLEDAPQKQDLQSLTALVSQSDQWRTTMQNHQNKQSMDFQRIDTAMSNTYNMLTSFLKAAQDTTNAIIRNGLG